MKSLRDINFKDIRVAEPSIFSREVKEKAEQLMEDNPQIKGLLESKDVGKILDDTIELGTEIDNWKYKFFGFMDYRNYLEKFVIFTKGKEVLILVVDLDFKCILDVLYVSENNEQSQTGSEYDLVLSINEDYCRIYAKVDGNIKNNITIETGEIYE